jgi:mRNA-degrading endonuclease RelE of RelBE toxin-antitoxin system
MAERMDRTFIWEPAARSDVRRLKRDTAMRILLAVTHFGKTGEGDVKRLVDRERLYRLRVGKWRVFFDLDTPATVRIHGIDNRGQAY